MSDDLERRYRRVLRLLPAWYRQQWEEDMVAAFLDSWLTGDPETDESISAAAWPSVAEITSVISLAARLYLGAAGTPGRYFAWGQAIRRAVLAVTLVQATQGLNILLLSAWSRHLLGWLPAPPAGLTVATPGGPLPPSPTWSGCWTASSPAPCGHPSGRGPSGSCSTSPRSWP